MSLVWLVAVSGQDNSRNMESWRRQWCCRSTYIMQMLGTAVEVPWSAVLRISSPEEECRPLALEIWLGKEEVGCYPSVPVSVSSQESAKSSVFLDLLPTARSAPTGTLSQGRSGSVQFQSHEYFKALFQLNTPLGSTKWNLDLRCPSQQHFQNPNQECSDHKCSYS